MGANPNPNLVTGLGRGRGLTTPQIQPTTSLHFFHHFSFFFDFCDFPFPPPDLSCARPPSAGPTKISLLFPSPGPMFALFSLSLWGSFRWRERKRAKMEAGEGKKARNVGSLRLRAPTLRAPTLRASNLRALTFSGPAPHPSGPPTLRATTPPGPTFSGFGPLRSSFCHISHLFFFCAFLIVSISCHFS